MKNIFILASLLALSACDTTAPLEATKQPTPIVVETPKPPVMVEEPKLEKEPAKVEKKKSTQTSTKPVATTPGALKKPL